MLFDPLNYMIQYPTSNVKVIVNRQNTDSNQPNSYEIFTAESITFSTNGNNQRLTPALRYLLLFPGDLKGSVKFSAKNSPLFEGELTSNCFA